MDCQKDLIICKNMQMELIALSHTLCASPSAHSFPGMQAAGTAEGFTCEN